MASERSYYIVVEGPIGVGKTTLVNKLAEALETRTVFEEFDENPFLENFYSDRDRYAFHTEMFFLMARFKQQEQFAQADLFKPYAVSDYLWEKCRLFAQLTLPEAELSLFDRVFHICSRYIPIPDLVIYLHAPLNTLLSRIEQRGRTYEQGMDADYIRSLSGAYEDFFRTFRACPVVSVDTTDLNFATSDSAVQLIVDTLHRRPTTPLRLPADQLSLFE
ncbi:MAG: deoxynucleoside kinase [Myxococcales bacterium]|nr:deoxynucleoside kinase [Myxococcales bacterium]